MALLFTGKSVNENLMNSFFNLLLNYRYVDEDVPFGKILKMTLSDWFSGTLYKSSASTKSTN